MKTARLLIISLVLFIGAFVSNAQDAPPIACDATRAEEVAALIEEQQALATTALESGDLVGWLAALGNVSAIVVDIEIECSGLAFYSEDLGLAPVIGPVRFPDGLYRITFTTKGYGIVEYQVIEGDCQGATAFGTNLFLLSQGQADKGAQTTFTASAGCTALITVSNTQSEWSLTFENLTN